MISAVCVSASSLTEHLLRLADQRHELPSEAHLDGERDELLLGASWMFR